MVKLKWKVSEAPTGHYKSFANRSWPTADLEDGRVAFHLYSEDEYVPALVKEGKHTEIVISVADWSEKKNTFVWKRLKRRAKTLNEAKEIAKEFAEKFPQVFVAKV